MYPLLLEQWADQVCAVKHRHKLTGISLPEVIDEEKTRYKECFFPKINNS